MVKGGSHEVLLQRSGGHQRALKDGWLLTGDMARTDEGRLHISGDRKKDVIISGGENIYPVSDRGLFYTATRTSKTWL